jgi:flagellar motility protein MotE (MotC chaperone)
MKLSFRVLPIVSGALALLVGLRIVALVTGFSAIDAAHASGAPGNAAPVLPAPAKEKAGAPAGTAAAGDGGTNAIPGLQAQDPAAPPADAKPMKASADAAPTDARPKIPGEEDFISPSEIQVLESLTKRREALDQRSAQLDMREQLLKATEKRLDQKLAQIKAIEDRIKSDMHSMDDKQKAQIASLVKVYSSMKPKDAAAIWEGLDKSILLNVAANMKDRKMAPILAAMNPKKARELTVMLAKRNAPPDGSGT